MSSRIAIAVTLLLSGAMASRCATNPAIKVIERSAQARGFADKDYPRFTIYLDLVARHPEVVADKDLKQWTKDEIFGTWWERSIVDDEGNTVEVSVHVESLDGKSLFASQVDVRKKRPRILKKRKIRLDLLPVTSSKARTAVEEAYPEAPITSIVPVVPWDVDTVLWQVQLRDFAGPILRVDQTGSISEFPALAARSLLLGATDCDPEVDALADNELHHAASMQAKVDDWLRNVPVEKTRKRAQIIYERISNLIDYNATYSEVVSAFTVSDTIILQSQDPQTKKYQGICDEFAVLAITALRAAKIPARLKLIKGDLGTARFAHAAVEFYVQSSGTWVAMDPAKKRFDKPASYRKVDKVTKVVVVDATCPYDAASQQAYEGLPDTDDDDGVLHPYRDFRNPLVFSSATDYSK